MIEIELLLERCDVCGRLIEEGSEVYALVPDSSVIHPNDPRQDGTRVICACSRPHLQTLRARCVQRSFVDEELWAGQIRRFLRHHPGHTFDLAELADGTGLTTARTQRALNWQQGQLCCPSP